MKLITKYNRINIAAIIIVLLLSGICYYFMIRAVLIHQLDKDLKVEEKEITHYIQKNNLLPEPTNYKDEQESYVPLNGEKAIRKFSSVEEFNTQHNENITYRQLEFPVSVAGKEYKIRVKKSQEETEDLVRLILIITVAMLLVLLATIFIINRYLLNNLWKPFNATLQQIKHFNLSGKNRLKLMPSDITEFTELNDAVSIMENRVSQDYDEIKNFTENASHEIQTPLAIIKSKLELLSQSESLKEEQMDTIQSVSEAANRLSKLNQSLILLTKIDNRQFHENEEISLGDLINQHLGNFEELIAAKDITVRKNINSNTGLTMNETLAETLISNLITNAIKHNTDHGFIEILLSKTALSVSNSGAALNSDPSELFERFKKDKVSSESLGLGLSIVKKICEKYGFEIQYKYADLIHTTTITFL